MNRKEMMDYMVRNYGHEEKWVVWFFECAEFLDTKSLGMAMVSAEVMIEHEREEAEKAFWNED